jgi:hypothetical protein
VGCDQRASAQAVASGQQVLGGAADEGQTLFDQLRRAALQGLLDGAADHHCQLFAGAITL